MREELGLIISPMSPGLRVKRFPRQQVRSERPSQLGPQMYVKGSRWNCGREWCTPVTQFGGCEAMALYVLPSNSRTTISGFDPSRSGGPQVPAPLDVNTCILPIRLSPYTNWR